MGEKFLRFKRRANMIRLLTALLIGLGVGAFLSGALNLAVRLELIALSPILPFLIGGGAALIVGGLLFFLLRVSDESLAVMLDSELSLDERVETMLQYKNEDSAIHTLQREDTEAALASVKTSSLRFKRLWLCLVIFLLGAAMLTASFFFKKEAAPLPEAPVELFTLTENQEKLLLDLAAEIEASDMQSPYREDTALLLRSLIEVLKLTKTVPEKNAAVSLAMSNILAAADGSSYAIETVAALWRTEHPPLALLAKALYYYEWSQLEDEAYKKYSAGIDSFAAALIPAEGEDALSEAERLLSKSGTGIAGALSSVKAPEDDPLRAALYRLATANEEYADGTRVYGLSKLCELLSAEDLNLGRELGATLEAVRGDIYSALLISKANTDTGEGAVKSLGVILDVEIPVLERFTFNEYSSSGGSSSDEGVGTGGAISGGTEYGSDELIYDPYTNAYLPYGEVLDRYYALMIGSVDNGNYTEKEREALMKYFSILYGGFEEGENSND